MIAYDDYKQYIVYTSFPSEYIIRLNSRTYSWTSFTRRFQCLDTWYWQFHQSLQIEKEEIFEKSYYRTLASSHP